MEPLILASGSPRRREILDLMGIPHRVEPSSVDESKISADHPRTFALRAAYAKALDVAKRQPEGTWVLAADTIVTRNLVLFGKPFSPEDARKKLRSLSGEIHEVITGLTIARAGSPTNYLRAASTRVIFKPLTDQQIDEYVATGEPLDKAGAYGIQGKGGDLIEGIEGDFYNVMGLPCETLADLMEEAGIELPTPIRIPEPPVRWRQ